MRISDVRRATRISGEKTTIQKLVSISRINAGHAGNSSRCLSPSLNRACVEHVGIDMFASTSALTEVVIARALGEDLLLRVFKAAAEGRGGSGSLDDVPGWCSFGDRRAFRTEPGTGQLAAAGRLMSGSSLIAAMVSRVRYLERWTAHSSFCSSSNAPTRRTMASSLGTMPTTSVRRLISPLRRSMGLVAGI